MLLVSPSTMLQIKAGQVVEVATVFKHARTEPYAVVRQTTEESEILFVNVTYSHSHFGRHFIFLALPTAPMQVSLAEDVAQKGAACK